MFNKKYSIEEIKKDGIVIVARNRKELDLLVSMFECWYSTDVDYLTLYPDVDYLTGITPRYMQYVYLEKFLYRVPYTLNAITCDNIHIWQLKAGVQKLSKQLLRYKGHEWWG